MRVQMSPAVEKTIDRLTAEREQVFGNTAVRLSVVHAADREASEVVKLAVAGAAGLDAVFVKVVKPKEAGPAARAAARERVVSEFEIMSRLQRSLAPFPGFRVAPPVACFPDLLALVTAAVPGETLSAMLERRATWWPTAAAQRALRGAIRDVGGWLRAVSAFEAGRGRFRLDHMRGYIDVRLRRLLETHPPQLDETDRARVLRYFDRTAAQVDGDDLRLVLTHADLAPSNIIVDGEAITIIDFATATAGGVFMDVARLYTQLEFLTAKPKFRPSVVRELQSTLVRGFDEALTPERPLFRLFVLQHLLCHMSNLARNPAPLLARLYNRHQLLLRHRWLQTFAA